MPLPFNVQGYEDRVEVQQPQLDSFQSYQDAAAAQARRYLDPQQQADRRAFDQSMINKGHAAGSEGYQTAFDNFNRSRNDANSSAAFGAMQFGQNAQNQAFNQGLGASQLANAMSLGNLQADTSRANAALAAETQRYLGDQSNALGVSQLAQNQSQFGDTLGLQRDQMGLDQQRFDDTFGFQQQQGDFSNLMSLGNLALGLGNYQNQGNMTDFNMAQAMIGGAPGNQQQQINVGGAYNTAQNGAMGQANLNQQGQQMLWGGMGDLAGAAMFLSGVAYKNVKGKLKDRQRAEIVAKILTMPIYDWEYLPEYRENNDHPLRFGPLAEDFNRAILGKKFSEDSTIDVQRYVSGLHMTVQDMSHEIRRLEALVWYIANEAGMPLDVNAHYRKGKPSKANTEHLSGKKAHDRAEEIEDNGGNYMQAADIERLQGKAGVGRAA